MIIIKTLSDLQQLREEKPVADEVLYYLEDHFQKLVDSLGQGEKTEVFNLADDGPLVVLEGDDDLEAEKLKKVGLTTDLLDSVHESVEEIKLNDKQTLWRIMIIHNNDYIIEYFLCPGGDFSQEVQHWLKEHCTAKKKYPSQKDTDLSDIPF